MHDRMPSTAAAVEEAAGGIFVNSMSDLFHDDVPDEFIQRSVSRLWAEPTGTSIRF